MKIFIILFFVKLNLASWISDSPCIDRPVQEFFDLEKIAGRWFLIAKYDNMYEKGSNCNYGDYVVNDKMSLKTIDCEMVDGKYICYHGLYKTELSDQFPLDIKYTYALEHYLTNPFDEDFKILSTDFENHFIMYACKNIENEKSQTLFWLASRTPKLNDSVKTTVDDMMDKYFDRKGIVFANQNSDMCEPRL